MVIVRQGPPPLIGALNADGVGKNRNSEPISASIVCCEHFKRLVLHIAATDHDELMTLVTGKQHSLLMVGFDDEVYDKKP